MRIRVLVPMILCMGLLAGCMLPGLAEQKTPEKDTLGLIPDFSYEVETQTPNILVNQIGYLPEGSKVAVLQGQNLESAYYVYEATSHEPAMEGSLEAVGDTLYLADFSSLKKEGSYYLYQKNLGYSDSFVIKEAAYDELEVAVLDRLSESNGNTSRLCYQLAALLFTLELYPDRVLEPQRLESLLKEKMAVLKNAQDQETGSVYENTSGTGEISLAATAEFAGIMAMYAGYLQPVDRILAQEYQNAAQTAYGSLQNSLDNVGYDAGYFAAALLFRITGRNTYAQAIGQYLAMDESQKSYTEYDFSVFADYGYLSGKYGINLDWSRQLMNKIREQATEVSQSANRSNYYVSTGREPYETDGMLRDMTVMSLVNHIIPNHEYTTLQKNYLDYFLGRNPEALCLAEGFGTRNHSEEGTGGIDDQNAALFYLLLQSIK